MKKRLFSLFLSLVIVLAYCSCALAVQDSVEPRASAWVYGGLIPSGSGGRYELWGRIEGIPTDTLTIRVELRNASGSYITGTSNSGQGPSVTASKYVTLGSGTYYIYLYGTTPTHSPSDVLTVVIQTYILYIYEGGNQYSLLFQVESRLFRLSLSTKQNRPPVFRLLRPERIQNILYRNILISIYCYN